MSRKQKKVNKTHHRRCSFEALEYRRLLAGNVTVSLVAGKATVTGDNLGNAIVITSAGVRAVANTNTTINGGAGPFAFTTAVNTLKVDMNGGPDALTLGDKPPVNVQSLLVTGKAEIKLGSDNDTFLYQNTTVGQKLHIHKGSGRDTVRAGTGNVIGKIKPKVEATALITGQASINEGATATINLSATPKNKKDKITSWSIEWGDGQTTTVTGNPTTATHQYAVADDYVITATATVAKKGNKKDTFKVDADFNLQVLNVAPTVTLNGPGSRSENGIVTLTGSYTDPGLTQGHLITVDWDDDNSTDDSIFEVGATNGAGLAGTTFTSTGNDTTTQLTVNSVNTTTGVVTFTVTHQYLDDGDAAAGNGTPSDDANIQVTVEDFVGPDPVDFTNPSLSSATSSVNVTINNVVPAVTVNPITAIVEAGSATVSGSFTDIGSLDDHTVTVNWGDGTQSVFNVPAMATPLNAGPIGQSSGVAATLTIGAGLNAATGFVPFSVQHVYANNGFFTVQVTVADDDGGSNSGSSTVNVTNANPIVAALVAVPSPVTENGSVTLTGNFTDVGVSDSHTVTVNWADPNNPTTSAFSLGATNTLSNGQAFNSTTGDGAVLTLTAAPTAGGLVAFSIATHTYRDDGIAPGNGSISDISNISVLVTDSDGGSGNAGLGLTVNNAAPSVQNLVAAAVSENDLATLNGQLTDVGLLDTHTITINWGDGTTNSVFSLGATNGLANGQGFISTSGDGASLTITSAPTATGIVTFQVRHRYLDDPTGLPDTYTIGVTVNDDDGGSSTNITTTVTVNNVVPTITDPPDTAVNENTEVTLSTTITDPGTLDTFTASVNWGDGAAADVIALAAVSFTDTIVGGTKFSWNAATRVLTYKHTYLDDNPTATASDAKIVTVSVNDDDSATLATQTTTVTVNNVAPTITDPADTSVNENSEVTLSTTITDPGTQDTFSASVNWGDGAAADVIALAAVAFNDTVVGGTKFTWNPVTRILTVKHTYLDDNPTATPSDPKTVTISVNDDDSLAAIATQTVTVTVNNVVPTITDPADTAINENSEVTLSTTVTDPGTQDTFNASVNWGDGAAADTIPLLAAAIVDQVIGGTKFSWNPATKLLTFKHTYADDNPTGSLSDNKTVTVSVTDDDSVASPATQTTNVLVSNVAPTISGLAVTLANESGTNNADFTTLTGTFTDVGLADTHTVTINWNDPNTATNSVFSLPATTAISNGNTFNSTSGDNAVLTVTSAPTAGGAFNFSVKHRYVDDGLATPAVPGGNGIATDPTVINVLVSDDDGGNNGAGTTLATSIANLPPAAAFTSPGNQTAAVAFSMTGTFTDKGLLDVHTLVINWNDATPTTSTFVIKGGLVVGDTVAATGQPSTLTVTAIDPSTGIVTFTATHTYAAAKANVVITGTISDDDASGNIAATPTAAFNVV